MKGGGFKWQYPRCIAAKSLLPQGPVVQQRLTFMRHSA
jgi:hypothetical protein